MTIRHLDFGARILLLALGGRLLPLPALGATGPETAIAAETRAPATATNLQTRLRLGPGPDDGRVADLTARLLVGSHYTHQLFDEEISSQFLDRYLEMLDWQHMTFLQSDIAQFEPFRTNLANLTITSTHAADTIPAFEIYSRFFERLKQRVAWVDEALQNEKFEFESDERIAIDRRDAPFPKDLNEAKALWRQRLRYEYLQEKLGLDAKKANPASTNATSDKVEPAKTTHEQIVATLSHRYHRTLRMYTDWNNEDVLGIYLTALARVYDPHSDYFNRATLESFRISMNLELFGIGAVLESNEEGYCVIRQLLPFGPAAKGGKINKGDRIVAVAQSNQPPVDVVDMHLTKAVRLIRGPKGTEVRLTIIPEDAKFAERRVISLIRDEIALDDQAANKGKIFELQNREGATVRLGLIDLPSFYAPMGADEAKKAAQAANTNRVSSGYASVDVARWLTKFKQEKVDGVILDLRGNGGGVLEEAIRLTGLFIKEGPVVQAREWTGNVRVERDNDPSVVYDGPLIVLTSRFSASASEIVAAALQDYGRALIVGDSSTHGKGTVQAVSYLSMLPQLSDPDPDRFGALKFTVRAFYRPTGISTQLRGVLPDIVLPSRWNYAKDIGESALENPLRTEPVESAKFDKLDLVQPYLSGLLKRSTERVATNQDFAYVREDIELFRKQQADKTISLNEKERLKEQAEVEARQKAREQELRARPEPDEKVYEITLKEAALPGLPAPVQKTNSAALKAARGPGQSLGTNTVSVSVSVAKSPDAGTAGPDGEPDQDKPAIPDASLNEAKRILMDYLLLKSAERGVTVVPAPKPAG